MSSERVPAVIYARVSTKDQEREGFSIPAQQKLLHEYADQHGFAVAKEFIDADTAKKTGRPRFVEMLAYLEKSRPLCRAVLVEKTDRLYRNFKDYTTLEGLDLEVHLVKEGSVALPRQVHPRHQGAGGRKLLRQPLRGGAQGPPREGRARDLAVVRAAGLPEDAWLHLGE